MWTFDDAPTAQVRAALGVRLDQSWLDRLEGASVRLSSGCSGSVVSPAGLVLTNEHCVLPCEEALSSAAADYVAEGFAADGRPAERECPGLAAEVLEGIVDATGPIFAASAGKTGADYVASRKAALADAEKSACGADPELRCQVISFFGGDQFKVYKYRRYDDVRLVFAPEYSVAFFGGDPDNFRFLLGSPSIAPSCGSTTGPARPRRRITCRGPTRRLEPGSAVFVSGNPGMSQRSLTGDQLATLRDLALPTVDVQNAELLGRLEQFSRLSQLNERAAAADLFELENTAKLLKGQRLALEDPDLLAA